MNSKFSIIASMALCVILTACGGDLVDSERASNQSGEAPPVDTPSTIPTAAPTNTPPPAEELQPNPTAAPSSQPVATPTVEPSPSQAPAVPDREVTYTIVVEWDIPSSRENGSDLLLSDIAGYEIFYKKVDDPEFLKIDVDIATTSEVTISDLSAGRYELYITTLDSDGLRSQNSQLLSATIGG
ncbi:MAG: hypothetical protein KTR17_06845 [Cellvibrionaceae bacterium]|nr:hypothetical protein [Cellvibrionaceae bacterium]